MKKKILSITLAAAMLTASTAVFADATVLPITAENQGVEVVIANNTAAYMKDTYKIDAVSTFDGFKAMFEASNETEGMVNLTISESTILVDNQGNEVALEDIKAGATVTMFYNVNNPTLMVLPPRYTPDVLVLNTENDGNVAAASFTEELVNTENTLALNIDDSTVIRFANGAKMIAKADDVKNTNALVFYTTTTRSIPAQTTPSKVVILGETASEAADFEEADINAPAAIGSADTILDDAMAVEPENYAVVTVNGKEIDAHMVDAEGVTMLPIRSVAEAMGLDVSWDNERQAVSVGTMQMGAFLKIGENKYSKAKMMAAELDAAPALITIDEVGYTYVPVSFFSEILEADVAVDEVTGSIAITYSAE